MTPKIIWFLWLQGLKEAPFVVQRCYRSWIRYNPGWEVVFLDENSITRYTGLQIKPASIQAYSDVLRINLLAEHGGVWADATCYCNKSLDDWLPSCLTAGFFAFHRPGPDRMISSWFMASVPGNYITAEYQKAVNEYWQANPGLVLFEKSRYAFLKKYLDRKNTNIWFTAFIKKALKIYPYFWFHYLCEYLYCRDRRFKELFDQMPKVNADIPHKLQSEGLFNPIRNEMKAEIDVKTAPVYKLTWKYNEAEYKPGTVMYYLLEK